MHEQVFDIHTFIRTERVERADGRWPQDSPFNLRFKQQRLGAEQRSALSGSGIYLLVKGDEVVYLGSYRPLTGRIIADRWARHLQTCTGRGYDLGFGGGARPSEERLGAILAAIEHADLRGAVASAHEHSRGRFRDTGYNTTPNRLRFASENWASFAGAEAARILDDMQFILVRRSASASARPDAGIGMVESQLLERFKPCCNRQFVAAQHQQLRDRNQPERVIPAIREGMASVFGEDASHCITLRVGG